MNAASTLARPLLKTGRRAALRIADRAVLSAVNGLSLFLHGTARRQIGNAAKELVMKRGKLELYRIRPVGAEDVELGHQDLRIELAPRVKTPILLIPPLMVRPWVFDLRPEHSLVRTLRNAGFDVFLVDFGVPDEADEAVRLDDYVLDYVPHCVDAALAASGAERITMAGYCMGGIFALLHAAAFDDPRVKNIVAVGAPVNFEQMGAISLATRIGMPFLDAILAVMGNVPGSVSSLVFRVLGGTKSVTRYADLLRRLYDEDYVRAFDSMDTWMREFIPYPKEAFRQMMREVVHGNKMLKNELTFGDRQADLRRITCPLLAFAGVSDNVATPASTQGILDLVSSADKSFHRVPGGHVGIIAGSSAPRAVWQPMVDWLRAHAA